MSLLPALVLSKRKGVTIALGCLVDDERGTFADPLAFEENDLLCSSGVEMVRTAWRGFKARSEFLSVKKDGESGNSSAVAERVSTVLID